MREITTAIVIALLLLPAGALAAEPAQAPDPEPAAQVEAPVQNAPEDQGPPAATPAQSPDDVAGGNEYSEQAPPTGTGDPDTPTTSPPEDDTEETTTQPAPTSTGGSTTSSTAGAEDATDAAATDALPRTGSEGWIIALIGIALVGSGLLLRRAALELH
jgi:LPXTG-motif cell wall-anchored protein